MENILEIKGKVHYKITLDPGVWIFDDRRIDLDTYFHSPKKGKNTAEDNTQKLSVYWDREIREGAVSPPTLKTERKYEKEKVLTGTFGIFLEPFINHAKPQKAASKLIIEANNEKISLPLEDGKKLILCFSIKGKPLKEDGPVHIYFPDGSNREDPIKSVKGFIVD